MRIFTIIILLLICFVEPIIGQEKDRGLFSLDMTYLNGSILEHNPDIGNLNDRRNTSLFVKYNRKTTSEAWAQRYNRPDWGFSALFQDLGNPILGENIAVYGHYNFYFRKRKLSFTIGTGISYNTKPYDPDTNFRNIAYGSHFMSSTFVGLTYKKPQLIGNVGLKAGVYLIHFSNGRLRTPNTSTNVLTFGLGLTYDKGDPVVESVAAMEPYSESIHLNAQFSGGGNENNIIGSGRFPFFGLQMFADKRLSYKSSIQLGTELFISGAMNQYIEYRSIAFPEEGLKGDEDSKRIGLFAGYELRLSRTAVFAHIGYYIYYPVEFEGRIYDRLGLKRYLGNHLFATVAVKAHAAKAEGIEFGLGYRL